MEQEIKRRGRPKKVVTPEDIEKAEIETIEETICGHFSLIEDKGGTYCALCGKRV